MRLIDADRLITGLKVTKAVVADSTGMISDGISYAIAVVQEFPVIEERKVGNWIISVNGNGWNDWYVYECSECGSEYEKIGLRTYNFCPNCGADMKEERKEK